MSLIHTESIRDPDRFNVHLSEEDINEAIDVVVKKTKHNIIKLGETFPTSSTVNDTYSTSKNVEWTTGFWTGILWLCYENTHEEVFKNLAEKNILSFKNRIINKIDVDNHDLGFIYIPSCVAGYKLTKNKYAREAAILAAEQLSKRYNSKGKFIQAWGKQGAADNYRLIVDALMNIPLLQWAAKIENNTKYSEIANNHFETTLKYAIREDGSAYHTYFFDNKTGHPLFGKTRQGYSDESSWARGQAWLIYGIPLNYRYKSKEKYLAIYNSITNYFLNRLPADFIPYWDLIFNDVSYQSKDSSAAAIAICGIDQMLREVPDIPNKSVYRNAEKAMLKNLIENYTAKKSDGIVALINHGVYSWHSGHGIDEGNLWGDYFYLEALTRMKFNWQVYW